MKKVISILLMCILLINNIYASDNEIDASRDVWGTYLMTDPTIQANYQEIDGMRVSVYNINGTKMGEAVDYSSNIISEDNEIKNYYGNTKLDYRKGIKTAKIDNYLEVWHPKHTIEANSGEYTIPKTAYSHYIVGNNKKNEARISGIVSFVTNPDVVSKFIKDTNSNITEENWESGEYKILIEPIGVFRLNISGTIKNYALTTSDLASLTKNHEAIEEYILQAESYTIFPLSLFLSKKDEDLNINSYGFTSFLENESLDTLMNTLGIGIVKKTKKNIPPVEATPSELIKEEVYNEHEIVYFTDMDIVTTCKIRDSGQGFPPQSKTPGTDEDYLYNDETERWEKISYYCKNDYLCDVTWYGDIEEKEEKMAIPPGGESYTYIKWRTPSYPCEINIYIDCSSGATPEFNHLTCYVINPYENTPPNPQATDRNDYHNYQNKDIKQTTSTSWKHYTASWSAKKARYEEYRTCDDVDCNNDDCDGDHGSGYVKDSHDCDIANCHSENCESEHKWYEDWGQVNYNCTSGTAQAKVESFKIIPDETIKSSTETKMRSGYGFLIEMVTNITYSREQEFITPFQRCLVYFPEFNYTEYFRLLEIEEINNKKTKFIFAPNKYSQFDKHIHFTPVWYKDGDYSVYAVADCGFTPNSNFYGLKIEWTGKITIEGSLYDDYQITQQNSKLRNFNNNTKDEEEE